MSNADASQQQHAANVRWRGQVVSRAASVVVERAAELEPDQRAEVIERLQQEDVSADD